MTNDNALKLISLLFRYCNSKDETVRHIMLESIIRQCTMLASKELCRGIYEGTSKECIKTI